MSADNQESDTVQTDSDTDSESGVSIEDSYEHSGRHIRIDTGFYEVQVHGDPEDNLADLYEIAMETASSAKADVQEMNKQMDSEERYHG